MWKEYRDLFDQVHASEALRMEVNHMTNQSAGGRRRATARQIVLIAAAIALLATAAVAAAVAGPTLRDHLFGAGPAYDRSSAAVGKSVTVDGWTATITDCVGDDYNVYLGIEIEAPEGTVLDRDDYRAWVECSDDNDQLVAGYSTGFWLDRLPDSNPTDNRVQFSYQQTSFSGGQTGITLHLKLTDLFHSPVWNEEKKEYDTTNLWEGTWDFGEITLEFTDTTARLRPNLPLGGGVTLAEINVSPLGVYGVLSGEAADTETARQDVIRQMCFLNGKDGSRLQVHTKGYSYDVEKKQATLVWEYEDGVLLDVSEIASVSLCGQTFALE